MDVNIRFVQEAETPRADIEGGKVVSGRLVDASGWADPSHHLAQLTDVHPGFVEHLVRCVNTYAAIRKVAQAENGIGPLTGALQAAVASPKRRILRIFPSVHAIDNWVSGQTAEHPSSARYDRAALRLTTATAETTCRVIVSEHDVDRLRGIEFDSIHEEIGALRQASSGVREFFRAAIRPRVST